MKKIGYCGLTVVALAVFVVCVIPAVNGQISGNPSSNLVLQSGDYDGDGYGDIAVFRASTGLWAIRGLTRDYFGRAGDIPASGDYDGDGTTDIAIYRNSNGLWAIDGITRAYYGLPDEAVPVPADWFGDGTCDIAIFHNGLWSIRGAAAGTERSYYGNVGDLPIPGDYNDDGTADEAIFRPSNGLWAIKEFTRVYFGKDGDVPVGSQLGGFVIYRPSGLQAGLWAQRETTRIYFGGDSDDLPLFMNPSSAIEKMPTIFRPSSGLWAISDVTRVYFGREEDLPLGR